MSLTLQQIYIANPITSNQSTDLMYFSQSPYTPGNDAGMTYANFSAQLATPRQIQESSFNFAVSTGADDAFVVTLTPPVTSLTDGLLITMSSAYSNLTTSPTLKVNALAAKPIILANGGTIQPGDISPSNEYIFVYNAASASFELINPTLSTANTFIVQQNIYNYAVDSGIANAYVIALSPVPISVVQGGMEVFVRIAHTNSGASTIAINGGSAKPIVALDGSALVGGELVINHVAVLVYNDSLTAWVLQNSVITSDGSIKWYGIAGTTQAATVNSGYVVQNAGQTTITLPATAALGSVVSVRGLGAAGWILAANTGQVIQVDGVATSSGGTLTSSGQYDSIDVTCVVANTTWIASSVLTQGLTYA